jgi:hypothetical protein
MLWRILFLKLLLFDLWRLDSFFTTHEFQLPFLLFTDVKLGYLVLLLFSRPFTHPRRLSLLEPNVLIFTYIELFLGATCYF